MGSLQNDLYDNENHKYTKLSYDNENHKYTKLSYDNKKHEYTKLPIDISSMDISGIEEKIQKQLKADYKEKRWNLGRKAASFIGMTLFAVSAFTCQPLFWAALVITTCVALAYVYKHSTKVQNGISNNKSQGCQFGFFKSKPKNSSNISSVSDVPDSLTLAC